MNLARTNNRISAVPRSVLVVEDDAILAMVIEDTLIEAGATNVRTSSSTADALKELRGSAFDAIILDVHLADRDDGYAIAELIDGLGPKGPRIIFSTGAPEDIPADVAALGCILEKPYEPAELLAIISQPKRTGIISRIRERFVER